MEGIKMKKILKYSTIIGAAAVLSYTVASADTGGYVRVKGFESHFNSFGIGETNCIRKTGPGGGTDCRFADPKSDMVDYGLDPQKPKENELKWADDDGEGIVAGADFGFFRLEVEGTYQDGAAKSWRGHTATGGTVYQARLFGNVVVEPFDLLALLGEFGGIEPLVKYNPATYGVSPYAMYGFGVMGGLVTNLAYTRTSTFVQDGAGAVQKEEGGFAGGATAAVNVGAGLNIGLDQLARTLSANSGATLPKYFKLPIEFQIGYHFQVGLDELLFDSVDEQLGIDDGGIAYSVGLKW